MPTTEKQQAASKRNWAKARIVGLHLGTPENFTIQERYIIDEIYQLRKKLLANWDENTQKLGFNINTKKAPV